MPLISHVSSALYGESSAPPVPCSRSASEAGYVVDRGVFDDVMVGQTHDASSLVALGSAALHSHPTERGVLSVVF